MPVTVISHEFHRLMVTYPEHWYFLMGVNEEYNLLEVD